MAIMVFQSFRTEHVPSYIPACLRSVEEWARNAGYTYEFFDDEFLRMVPGWYREKAGWRTCVVADLARLMQARTYLLQGVEQVVWVDADVVVFDPERFRIPSTRDFRYCKEVWLHRSTAGVTSPVHKVNNAICTFGLDSIPHLSEYIDCCLAIVRAAPEVSNSLMVGTDVLTSPFSGVDRIEDVGIVGPVLLQAILREEDDLLRQYIAWHGSPVFAANLCNIFRGFFGDAPGLFDYLLERAIEKLLATGGGLLAERPMGEP